MGSRLNLFTRAWNSSGRFYFGGMQQNNPFSAFLTPAPAAHTLTWPFVRRRFERFLGNLALTSDQIADGETKQRGAVACLNQEYWNIGHETLHSIPSGSYAKGTRVRPPRDIDFLFQLPFEVYQRFQQRIGNRQSHLLQEVKDVLAASNPATRIRGDGQVVVVPLNTYARLPSRAKAVAISFATRTMAGGTSGSIPVPSLPLSTHATAVSMATSASLRACSSSGSATAMSRSNPSTLRRLLWRRLPDIPTGATTSTGSTGSCDLFAHMTNRANGTFSMPVTGETIQLGDVWLSKAQSAYARALKACVYERDDLGAPADDAAAGDEWQKIFGLMISRTVTGP